MSYSAIVLQNKSKEIKYNNDQHKGQDNTSNYTQKFFITCLAITYNCILNWTYYSI